MTIGKNIADLRKSNGMTQEQLAETLGVSSQTVSKWENEIIDENKQHYFNYRGSYNNLWIQ